MWLVNLLIPLKNPFALFLMSKLLMLNVKLLMLMLNCIWRCFRILRFEGENVWLHAILKQNPKYLWYQTNVEDWTLWWKLNLFMWLLWWFCNIEVLNKLSQSVQGSLLLENCYFSLNVSCHAQIWSFIDMNITKSLHSVSPDFRCKTILFTI